MSAAVESLVFQQRIPDATRAVPVEISDTKSPEHGDYACNFAMAAAKAAGMNPRALAEAIGAEPALAESPLVASVEIAGPGFMNFRLRPEGVAGYVSEVLTMGSRLAAADPVETPLKINVEFVSVNPNGPITVGSGRGAAFGDTLCRILSAAGHRVHREYYINDGVNSEQMRQFALSVQSYVEGTPFPEKGYRGDYVTEVAKAIDKEPGADVAWYQERSQRLMIEQQRTGLALFGVQFDTWFSEQSLHDQGVVEQLLQELEAKGVADRKPFRTVLKMGRKGVTEDVEVQEQPVEEEVDAPNHESSGVATTDTVWLRSTKFADDMDRVLRRKDGRLTYIASDVAYHRDKLMDPAGTRGTGPVDKMITILGPDHHGYIGRLTAVVAALLESEAGRFLEGEALNEIESKVYRSPQERDACQAALEEARRRLEVVIFQIVRFVKDGQPAPMRKRDGNIYELRDLINELGAAQAPQASRNEQQRIGRDVARFFYLMRSHDTHMDFDIDLATKQSDENPVFYVQYAHARICSVLLRAGESREDLRGRAQPSIDELIGRAHEHEQLDLDLARRYASERIRLANFDPALLTHPREQALIKKILDLPHEVRRTADDYAVHRLTTYAVDLARTFHHFYDACRVIQPDQPDLTLARLVLCEAARIALATTLEDLLGVSAPERMERGSADEAAVPSA